MTSKTQHIREIAEEYVTVTGGVIGAIRSIQSEFQCVPEEADPIIADVFNLSKAEVRGIVSFYADFSREQKAKTVIRVCAAEACQAVGGTKLNADLKESIKGGSLSSSDVQLEKVYCLGLCSVAPAAMVDGDLIGRADKKRIEEHIASARKTV